MRDSYRRQATRPDWMRARRRASERCHRRRRVQRGRATARAAVSARTSRTPASFSTRAHASSVAPVVLTSSTSTTTAPRQTPWRAVGRRTRRRMLRWRCAADRPVCVGVARMRAKRRDAARRSREMPRQILRLIESAVRAAARDGAERAPRQSAPSAPRLRAAHQPASGRAIDRRPSYFSACTIGAERTVVGAGRRARDRRDGGRAGTGQPRHRHADDAPRAAADRRSNRTAAA